MGKLNILHHKSYHVYNRENIERVKRDELQAELDAEAKDQSTIAANSEARLTLLRSQKQQLKKESSRGKERRIEKALEDQLRGKKPRTDEERPAEPYNNNNKNSQTTDNSSIIDPKNGHINFWSSLENQSTSKVFGSNPAGLHKNSAYMNDLKKKNDKWEEFITMRLDKPAHELLPWYSQNDLINGEEKKLSDRKIQEKISKDESFKKANDPLTLVKSSLYPSKSDKYTNPRKRKERRASRSPSPAVKGRVASFNSSDEELEDMPALPPTQVNKDRGSGGTAKEKSTAPRILKVDESAERLKAQALLERHHAPTPRTEVAASPYGYTDLYNRDDVEAIRRHRPYNHPSSSNHTRRYWDSKIHPTRDWETSPPPKNRNKTRYWNH